MPEVLPFDLPFDEAMAFFASKGLALSPNSWRDVWQDAHARAFTVARVTSMDVLTDIQAEVKKAIDSGTSLGDFKSNLRGILEQKGWFAPKGEDVFVTMPDGTTRKRLNAWRIENIYRTNLQSAYAVGRYEQMMETADLRPFWQYKAILDSRTRPTHAAMNDKVYRYDHPIWGTWYPPNGFACRCFVKSLMASDVRERGLKVETDSIPELPDEGWRYNVGESGMRSGWEPDWKKYPQKLLDEVGIHVPRVPSMPELLKRPPTVFPSDVAVTPKDISRIVDALPEAIQASVDKGASVGIVTVAGGTIEVKILSGVDGSLVSRIVGPGEEFMGITYEDIVKHGGGLLLLGSDEPLWVSTETEE